MIEAKEYSCQAKKSVVLSGTYDMTAFKNGSDKAVALNGIEIQSEYKIGTHTLLITSYDCFDCVNYWFNLLAEDLTIVDVVSTPEYFGFMQDVEIHPSNRITFGFHGTDDMWELKCMEKGSWNFSPIEIFRRPLKSMFRKRFLWLKKY